MKNLSTEDLLSQLIALLFLPYTLVAAFDLHRALSSSDFFTMIEIICSYTDLELTLIKKQYQKRKKKSNEFKLRFK